jgi:hypothetical protein
VGFSRPPDVLCLNTFEAIRVLDRQAAPSMALIKWAHSRIARRGHATWRTLTAS